MNPYHVYEEWLYNPTFGEKTKVELRAIANQNPEIEDRFYKYLEFGTGGMRGVLGAGTNRINRYTVRRVTQGLANYISSYGQPAKEKGVVIAYDSRHQSAFLGEEAACTLVANGIGAYLFNNLRPTPELSFAIRHMQAQAGIMITASHNPPEYNGFKVYWEDGGQITSEVATSIIGEIDKINDWSQIIYLPRAKADETNLLQVIGDEVDEAYLDQLKKVCLNPDVIHEMSNHFSLVYSPLHGAGNPIVPQILRKIGFLHVHSVPEQEQPDPNFSTVKSPNPEEKETFELVIAIAQEKHADLAIVTDPDCDRVGVAVRNREGEFEYPSGNQIGALLLEYLISVRKRRGLLPDRSTVVTTIVSSELGSVIANKYGVDTIKTLTGFKYIAEQIRLFEEHSGYQFLFGYEESYGYLASTAVRDKDAVMATMLICEMAVFYKQQGKSLLDVLADLFTEHDYFLDDLEFRMLKGKKGVERIQAIMEEWRSNPPAKVGEKDIVEISDYLKQITYETTSGKETVIQLPKENVLQYRLEDGSWFCLRPSGTEPKIKVYFSVRAPSFQEAARILETIKSAVMEQIDSF
ncbi:phosphoglucomutase [Brevibacillus laterosporus]|uniref:phospho-sugar mutase n=1 Tax=Brevibacillus laterosporus TaxID=1465 RepID=UPI000C756CDF|nr:phosphoglucomutase [Brevibacillus laterosporus]